MGTLTQAQITLSSGGMTITNGQELVYNSVGSAAKMQLLLTNNTAENVYFRIQLVSVSNNTSGVNGKAGNLQLCFGDLCYISIGAGNSYPEAPVQLAANGGQNDPADHFVNEYEGDATGDVTYSFKVVQVDADQNVLGDIVNFSYRYSATASVNDFTALQNMGITLGTTLVNSQMDITSLQNAKLELFNINGQLVKTVAINAGTQSVDTSAIESGMYFARFTNEENKTSQIRVVKN